MTHIQLHGEAAQHRSSSTQKQLKREATAQRMTSRDKDLADGEAASQTEKQFHRDRNSFTQKETDRETGRHSET